MRGVPNPDQPGRCPSFDPYGGDLQCGRSIHEDDQCVFGGIAWKKGTPPELSDRERAKAAEARAEAAEALVADYEHRISWNTTCKQCAETLDLAVQQTFRAQQREAAIERVRAQHTKAPDVHIDTIHRGTTDVYGDGCVECGTAWPCDTIVALEPVQMIDMRPETIAKAMSPVVDPS